MKTKRIKQRIKQGAGFLKPLERLTNSVPKEIEEPS